MGKGTQIDKDYKEIRTERLNVVDDFQIGGTQVTATATELNALDGITATPAEINLNDNQPASVTLTPGAEGGSNDINVACQVKDADGTNMAVPCALRFYLADDSAGLTPSGTAPTGGIAIGTDGALIESVDNLSGTVITEADGAFDITLIDTGTPTFYLVIVLPTGLLQISSAITFA